MRDEELKISAAAYLTYIVLIGAMMFGWLAFLVFAAKTLIGMVVK